MKKVPELPDNSPDLTNFIRSIQKLEGNPDCFGTANGNCDRLDCTWRTYCLGKIHGHLREDKKVLKSPKLKGGLDEYKKTIS